MTFWTGITKAEAMDEISENGEEIGAVQVVVQLHDTLKKQSTNCHYISSSPVLLFRMSTNLGFFMYVSPRLLPYSISPSLLR